MEYLTFTSVAIMIVMRILIFLLISFPLLRASEDTTRPPLCTRHPLYRVIAPHHSSVSSYDVFGWLCWALFGNDDDGIFGEGADYRPEEKHCSGKAMRWWLRNPCHNLVYYVLGTAHRKNSSYTLLQVSARGISLGGRCPTAHKMYASQGTCFLLVLNGGKPFVSFRIRYCRHRTGEFYFGWRCRGNFGIKCAPYKKTRAEAEKKSLPLCPHCHFYTTEHSPALKISRLRKKTL